MEQKTKILIIEDNEQNMYMLTYLLKSNHYEVIQSFNGKDGLKKAKIFLPDAILLDIQLPEMDGYKIASELRKMERLKKIPIIAVTSYAMLGDKEKSIEAGADGYIEKPIDPDIFVAQMESIFIEKNPNWRRKDENSPDS